jgi:hypothetical protein
MFVKGKFYKIIQGLIFKIAVAIPLIEYGYIDSYEIVGEDAKSLKYIIRRFGADSNGNSRDVVGSVKDVVGSVKKNRC